MTTWRRLQPAGSRLVSTLVLWVRSIMTSPRWFRFYAVGAAGMVVQAGVFAVLTLVLARHYLVATAIAVEMAVLHNFFWHRRWTWADRRDSGALGQLLRFHLTTGVASIGGNLLFMRLLVGGLHLHPLLAGLVTVAGCSLVNFVVSDKLVFSRVAQPLGCRVETRLDPCPPVSRSLDMSVEAAGTSARATSAP